MFHKICFIFFMLIFICLYLYVKIESFDNPTQPTLSGSPISTQLTSEIGRVLNISSRRVINVNYTGDISTGSLMVGFIILEPNATETTKREPSATDAAKLAHQLTSTNTFKVIINGLSISLSKLPKPTTNTNLNTFFDNPSLKEISDYTKKKSISVPNDASLTNFYKLGFDNRFNIVPKLETQPTVTSNPSQTKSFS